MNPFNLNFNKLLRQIMPSALRRGVLLAWLKALLLPFKSNYAAFMAQRADNLYAANHSSQLCRMRAVLNDSFDATLRRITIDDAPTVEAKFIYRRAENKPLFIHTRAENEPAYINRRSEMTDGGAFVVNVPVALEATTDIDRMRAVINFYRLATKTNYQIIFS